MTQRVIPRPWLVPLLLVLLAGTLVASEPSASRDPKVKWVSLANVAMLVATAPDTTTMTAGWQLPTSDGKGASDSLVVRFVGVGQDTAYVFRTAATFPTTLTHKRAVPVSAYTRFTDGSVVPGQDAIFDTFVEVTIYRRRLGALVRSAVIKIALKDAAPQPVGGLTFASIITP